MTQLELQQLLGEEIKKNIWQRKSAEGHADKGAGHSSGNFQPCQADDQ